MTRISRRALSVLAAVTLLVALIAVPNAAKAAGVTVSGGSHDLSIPANTATGATGTSTSLNAVCDTAGHTGITWTSSDNSVATVSTTGTVTAVSNGSAGTRNATITATCADAANDGSFGEWNITVTQAAPPAPVLNPTLSIGASPNSFTTAGDIGAVTATVTDYTPTSYAWSISGSSIRFAGGATQTTTTTNSVQFVTQSTSGTSTVSCVVSGGTGTAPTATPASVSVQIPAPVVPTLSVSASPSSFSDSGAAGTATATVTNYTPTSYVWSISGNSVRFSANGGTSITTTTNAVSFVTQSTDGTSTITCTVSGGTGAAPAAQSASVYVDLPDPYLAVWLDHDTLTWLRPKTEAHAELHYPNSTVTNDARIYWSSSHTKIATVSGVYDHLEHGYATAVVRAKANGTTTITAYTSHQRVYDSASLLVTGYKHLPQSGQDTRLLYAEGAVLLLLLSAAGIVYARRRKDSAGK